MLKTLGLLTPLLIVYLIMMDFIFTMIDVLMTFIILILTVFRVRESWIDALKDCSENVYRYAFGGLSKINIIGFRRLKTSSQLTFESMPQILMQIYIMSRLASDQDELSKLGLSYKAFLISIGSGILHGILEAIQVHSEKKMSQADLFHYLIISFNGRFGWIPLIDQFNDQDHQIIDYDNMSTNMFCTK